MQNNKKIAKSSILIFSLLLLVTIAYARPFTDFFVDGLVSVNDFFVGQQFAAYATAIDFFFFSLLFISIYMIGARYAFKEIKRPEQVIVILLGLMTAFLLVLAGFSATLLLPYIHWILYLLLFILYWWMLKGIKNPFWRFVLALLLTLLTIALLQGLFDYLTRPEVPSIGDTAGGIGGFFRDLFGSLSGIEMPGIPTPGVPDWASNLLQRPSEPTGPEPLPIVPTPTPPPTEGWPSWIKWILIPVILFILAWLGKKVWDRIRGQGTTPTTPTTPAPPTSLQDLINKIGEIIRKKSEHRKKIEDINRDKNAKLQQADAKRGYIARLIALKEKDIANLFLDESRKLLDKEEGAIKEIMEKEWEFAQELRKLYKVEHDEILKNIDGWKTLIQNSQNIADDKKKFAEKIINSIKILLGRNIAERRERNQDIGILFLIAFCYNLEKKQNILAKELTALFEPKHIEELVKGKFKEAIKDEATLETYNTKENELVALLLKRIGLQIRLLEKLKEILGTAVAQVPVAHEPTTHHDWPGPPTGKRDPKPPEKPVFPIEPVIPPPPKPKPTKHKEVFVDLSKRFLPIKNQNSSSACAAFAGTSIVEYMMNPVENRKDFENDLSELFLWWEIRTDKNVNMGVYRMSAVPHALINHGDCFEKIWEWEPLDPAQDIPVKFQLQPPQTAYTDALTKRIVDVKILEPDDPDSWVDELLQKNPVLIAVGWDTGLDAVGNARRNLFYQKSGTVRGGHAIVIVGFTSNFPDPTDPKKGIPAFKIRNSWGKNWGENGYIWIPYGLLPTLLIDKPYVFIGWQKKGEEQEIDVLTLTPLNSVPKGDIIIQSIHHDATEMPDAEAGAKIGLKIGKNLKEKTPDINLIHTHIDDKLQAVICYYKEHHGHHNVFKIFPMPLERTDVIIVFNDDKRIQLEPFEKGLVFPGWIENVKKIRINEYEFAVKVSKEKVLVQSKEEYLNTFSDKNLRLLRIYKFNILNTQFLINVMDLLKKSKFKVAKLLIKSFFKEDEAIKQRDMWLQAVDYIESNEKNKLDQARSYLIKLRELVEANLEQLKNQQNKFDRYLFTYVSRLKKELDEFIQILESRLGGKDETAMLIEFIRLLQKNKFEAAKKLINNFYEDARNKMRVYCLNIHYNLMSNKLVEAVLKLREWSNKLSGDEKHAELKYEIDTLLDEIETKGLQKPTRGYKISILALRPTNSIREDNREAYPIYITSIYHRRNAITIGKGSTFNVNLKDSDTAGLQATIQAWDNNDKKTKEKKGYDPKKHGKWKFIIRHEQGNVIVDNTNLKDLQKNKYRLLLNGSNIRINGYEFDVIIFATDKEFTGNTLKLYKKQLITTLVIGTLKPRQKPEPAKKDKALILTLTPLNSVADDPNKIPIKIIGNYHTNENTAILMGKGIERHPNKKIILKDLSGDGGAVIQFFKYLNLFGLFKHYDNIQVKDEQNNDIPLQENGFPLGNNFTITVENYAFRVDVAEEALIPQQEYDKRFDVTLNRISAKK